jgi:hypothetical protein
MRSTDTDLPPTGRLTRTQREALWTWTWLGWRGGTPAFKGSLALAAATLVGIIAYWVTAR